MTDEEQLAELVSEIEARKRAGVPLSDADEWILLIASDQDARDVFEAMAAVASDEDSDPDEQI